MAGLVLEGGSLRGVFSAGCLDALLDNNIEFSYVIGVSAGITNGVSYISKQRGRNIEVLKKYRNDKRYLSANNYFKTGSYFGQDFLFDEIPSKLMPFDWDTYYNFPGEIKIGITNANTGKIEYHDGKTMDHKCLLLRATCAIPLASRSIEINGINYFDGGIGDSIPFQQSLNDGNDKNLVILTQPKDYQKKQSKSVKFTANFYKKKYPNLAQTINERADKYNETINLINEVQKNTNDNIVVIQPEYSLNSFEKDINVLEQTYQHGYDLVIKNLDSIRRLI